MANKYDNLVEEINKQEEVKEEKDNLGGELRLLKQAVSNLQDCVSKVEQADKDGTDMTKALNAATDSMDMAVFAFSYLASLYSLWHLLQQLLYWLR